MADLDYSGFMPDEGSQSGIGGPELRGSSQGFTSVELIIVMMSLTVLAGTAIVSFRVTSEDKTTIAADQLIADIQYVQMRAMGVGVNQRIEFRYDSGDLSKYKIVDSTGGEEVKRLPDGATVESTNFSNILKFNSLGEPFYGPGNSNCTETTTGLAGDCSITLRDNVTINIYAVTGKTCLYDTSNNRCFQ